MALSANQTISKGGNLIGGNTTDSRHNPNKQKDPLRTYAQILNSQQARDVFDMEKKSSEELGQLTEGGQLFLQARDKNSIVIATKQFLGSEVNFKDLSLALREQFSAALGLRIRNATKDSKYFEINFRSGEAREEALKKDFFYKDNRVTISRTFPKDTTIVRVSVHNLPHEDESILKPRMEAIFAEFGEILEMGLNYTVHGHFFTGRGFVTLNLLPGKQYKPLSPQLSSWEEGEMLKLTYTGMKPICSRCHVNDHVFGNCPKMIKHQVKSCYICSSADHLQAKCPKAWWNQNKQARKSQQHASANQSAPVTKAVVVPNALAAETIELVSGSEQSNVAPDNAPSPVTQTEAAQVQKSLDTTEAVMAPEVREEELDASDVEDDDMEFNEEELACIDVNMEDAAKEADVKAIPIDEVVMQMRLRAKLQQRREARKAKKPKVKEQLGASLLKPRSGGSSVEKKKSTTKHNTK